MSTPNRKYNPAGPRASSSSSCWRAGNPTSIPGISRKEKDRRKTLISAGSTGREVADEAVSAACQAAGPILSGSFDGSLGQCALPRSILRAVRAYDESGAAEGTPARWFGGGLRVRQSAAADGHVARLCRHQRDVQPGGAAGLRFPAGNLQPI